MTRNALRIAWTVTGIAALVLLTLTVTLAIRARSLPQPVVAAPASPAPVGDSDATASPTRIAATGPADNGLIAFSSDRDGNVEIYVMQPDGSDIRYS